MKAIFQSGSYDRIQLWLESTADVNIIIDGSFWRPIHFIANHGFDGLLVLLIQLGANVNARTILGDTPLIVACRAGSIKCVDILVQSGACKNSMNVYNTTAFSSAALGDHYDCVKYLLDCGIREIGDVSLADEWVKTTLTNRRHAKDLILFFETLLRKRLGVCKDMTNVI